MPVVQRRKGAKSRWSRQWRISINTVEYAKTWHRKVMSLIVTTHRSNKPIYRQPFIRPSDSVAFEFCAWHLVVTCNPTARKESVRMTSMFWGHKPIMPVLYDGRTDRMILKIRTFRLPCSAWGDIGVSLVWQATIDLDNRCWTSDSSELFLPVVCL